MNLLLYQLQGLGVSDAVTYALPGAGLGHLDHTAVTGMPKGNSSSESSDIPNFSSQPL